MPAVDTNVLLRLLVEDDDEQTRHASAFVRASGQVFVCHLTLLEAAWVLESGYGMSRTALGRTLDLVLATSSFRVERPDIVAAALDHFRSSSADFADCMILATAKAAGELPLGTFDAAASRLPETRRLGKKVRSTSGKG